MKLSATLMGSLRVLTFFTLTSGIGKNGLPLFLLVFISIWFY